jgi:3-dehydroquinate dehydratase/shikimate dehydrogenase
MIIETERLMLRPWKPEDLDPFAELNADTRVMEYFPACLTREESDLCANKIIDQFNSRGWGLWAVTVKDGPDFIGYVGLNPISFDAHFTPALEIGWRLAYPYWGKGYAVEGAKAVLHYAFETLKVKELVSITVVKNLRSRRVMEKIGMTYDPKDDFDHPRLAEDSPLRRHVLYRIRKIKKN